LYVLIVTPVFETLLSTSFRAAEMVPAEQSLAGADHHREDPDAELIDEVVLEQRLDQTRTALDLDLRSVLVLQRGDVARRTR
jgi:hypothetical protein